MISDPLERLRAANPEPWCPPPPIDDVWRRIEADDRLAHGRVVVRPGRPAALGARLRSLGGVIVALTSVAVVIAVGAIALLSHGRGTVTNGSSGGAQQLIARLAVLRRPQTAADVLPSRLHIMSPLSPPGTIIPRLTRLVRTLPDARLYLVVTTPSADSIWSPRLGDQVSIVEISGGHATETVPIPAVDLTNANEVFDITPAGLGAPARRGAYFVGIVPDGVARVRWTFANDQFEPGAVLDGSVASNVAVARARPDTPPLVRRAAWYAPDGQRVATSNQALLAAQAAHDSGQKAQAIRYDRQHAHHADPSLLAAFAVFAITSPTGVKTAAGDIISRPPFSSLSLDIVQGGIWVHPPVQLDPSQVRQVITPSGARLYVIPGTRGLCLLTGGGGGSCNLLPGVETHGLTMTVGSLGVTTTYKIVPKTIHSITIRNSRGTRTTILVPDGIYVSPGQRTANNRLCQVARQAPRGFRRNACRERNDYPGTARVARMPLSDRRAVRSSGGVVPAAVRLRSALAGLEVADAPKMRSGRKECFIGSGMMSARGFVDWRGVLGGTRATLDRRDRSSSMDVGNLGLEDGPYRRCSGAQHIARAVDRDAQRHRRTRHARQAGLASGLLNTSNQLSGAIGIAIASSIAATHTHALLHAGDAAPAALTGGFQQAFWVLGVIALLAVPAIFALVRRNALSPAATKTTIRDTQPAFAPAK